MTLENTTIPDCGCLDSDARRCFELRYQGTTPENEMLMSTEVCGCTCHDKGMDFDGDELLTDEEQVNLGFKTAYSATSTELFAYSEGVLDGAQAQLLKCHQSEAAKIQPDEGLDAEIAIVLGWGVKYKDVVHPQTRILYKILQQVHATEIKRLTAWKDQKQTCIDNLKGDY